MINIKVLISLFIAVDIFETVDFYVGNYLPVKKKKLLGMRDSL